MRRGATETTVDVSARQGRVTATIADNGRGLDVTSRRGGHGIENMAARAARYGGDLVVEAGQFGGTVVRLHIPLDDV